MTDVEQSEKQDVSGSGKAGAAVVVGLDGSPQSHFALSWAAANTSGPVQLVVA